MRLIYTKTIPSPVGPLLLASDGTAITGLWLKDQKYFAATLTGEVQEATNLPMFWETEAWLEAYFSQQPLPAFPALAPQGSSFQQAVWKILQEIPYGETTTYGGITNRLKADGIPAAPQAVGGAVGHNPISILIPCHRVLGANGGLTGYAGGIHIKRQLLTLEGVQL